MKVGRQGASSSHSHGEESFADRVQRRAKEREQGGGAGLNLPSGAQLWRPVMNTKTRIDIIPYRVTVKGLDYAEPGQLWYERTYKKHYNVGGSNKHYVCPESVGKPCPVCEYARNLNRQNDPESKEQAKALRPKMRQLFNVLDHDAVDKGIQVLEIAYANFGRKLDEELKDLRQDDPSIDEFSDLKSGRTLKVRWGEGKQGQGRVYTEATKIDFLDRSKPLSKDLLEDAVDLDALLIIPSYEEIEKVFNGADDSDEDEDKPKRPSKDKASGKKRPSDDEDDDDEEYKEAKDDEDDDDEPKRKSKKKPSDDEEEEVEVEDYDVEDEDGNLNKEDEPDDEDEEPKHKKGKPHRRHDDEEEEEEPEEEEEEDDEDVEPKRKKKSRR